MADPVYAVDISFVSGSYTHVTSDCIACSISRKSGSFDNGLSAGRATLVLDNFSAKFTENNSASVYYPNIKLNKPIRVQATHSGSTYNIFNGFIDSYDYSPDLSNREVVISASDRIKDFQKRTIDTTVVTSYNVSSLFTDILSASAVSSADRAIDAMTENVPFAWYQTVRPIEAINKLVELGYYRSYIGVDGKVNIKNRYWGIGGTVIASYVSSFHGIGYSLDESFLSNHTNVGGTPRKIASSVQSVAWILTTPTIQASSGIGFWLTYNDPLNNESGTPCTSMVTPINSLDYKSNAGSTGGADSTSTTSTTVTFFGASAVCSVFNGSSNLIYLTRYVLRGTPIQRQNEISFQTDDTSSQNVYGRYDLSISNDLIGEQSYARDYSTFLRDERKEPRPVANFELKNSFPDVLARELGDLVWLVESNAGINGNWIIREVNHEITMERGLEHTASYTAEKWVDRGWLILDSATQGILGTNKVGF